MTVSKGAIAGWDLGGAHLKVAQLGADGAILEVCQQPCPLWQGRSHLIAAIEAVRPLVSDARRHAVTMTGELVDLFDNRRQGVAELVTTIAEAFPGTEIAVFAGPLGFREPGKAVAEAESVASANWFASVSLLARRWPAGLFVDVGSTTIDLVPFAEGSSRHVGYSDAERLTTEELIYSGVVRTPIMAMTDQVPFAGQRQAVMAEYFATMADAYRLLGELPEGADLLPAADGKAKDVTSSRRRLARMLGRDAEDASPAAWRRLARHLAELQLQQVQSAAERVLSRELLDDNCPICGAGVGRFLAERVAARLGRPYQDFADAVGVADDLREPAARCAPAVSVALLLAES